MRQTLSLERPFFLGFPSSCSARMFSKYISSIHTHPDSMTQSCHPLSVEKTLWHMISTIFMILSSGSFAFANMVPESRLNLAPQDGQRYLVGPI